MTQTGQSVPASRSAGLRSRRRVIDVVWLSAFAIVGSTTLFALGFFTTWPLYVSLAGAVVILLSLVVRSQLTKAIWRLDPPVEPSWKRLWLDDISGPLTRRPE